MGDFDGSERLAAVLGADIVSTFENPEESQLGSCKKIEEIMIGEDKVIKFSGCASGEACTIILRGASQHILDEAERSLMMRSPYCSKLSRKQEFAMEVAPWRWPWRTR